MSNFFVPTLKEVPADAVVDNHKLMIRSGMIRKLSSGLYSYLPIGLRIFKKVEEIIRSEMNKAGAQEFSLPILTPAELWQKTLRWDAFGAELIRIRDRNDHWNALGPTHEEVFTEIVRTEISSYKQLPVNFYQIKSKFRDEIRPRFGVMRCREFTMKDAYSFDIDEKGLDVSYEKMRLAYSNIFKRCGLDTAIVEADTGAMGGTRSEEFMVVSDIGEEILVICEKCGYSANLEKAVSKDDEEVSKESKKKVEEVDTPGAKTIEELMAFFKSSPRKFIKTIIYVADEKPVVALIRGDLEINETKLKNAIKAQEMELAGEALIKKVTKAEVGFAGPMGLNKILIYA
ncbi:MAG: proline--tRNA ligase, partial [Spirochaetes bacterium]|nr:proline--tRNA ligase [Spirochaetota bacterium]